MISLKMKPALKMMSRLSMAHSARSASSMMKSNTSGSSSLFVKLGLAVEAKNATINATGSDSDIITTSQIKLFGMEDDQLREHVKRYFGQAPNWVTVGPSGLYETCLSNSPRVQVVLKPVSAKIIGVTSKPVILATKTFSNNSDIPATFHADISSDVTDTFESTYSTSFAVAVGQDVSYGLTGIGSGTTSLSFTAEFGEASSQSSSNTIGESSGVTVTLKPKESVIANLSSFRGTLKARVTYEASLTGQVACHYSPTFKGHYYYGMDVNGVMGSPTKIIEEDIAVDFYSTGTVNVMSTDTANFISTAGKMVTTGN